MEHVVSRTRVSSVRKPQRRPKQTVKDTGIGIALLAASVAGMYFLFKKKGKGSHTTAVVNPQNLPPGFNARAWANDLYNTINGWNFNLANTAKMYVRLLDLPNDQFKAVYNQYNADFTRPPKSMKTDVLSEWIFDFDVLLHTGRRGVITALEQKFNALNLA